MRRSTLTRTDDDLHLHVLAELERGTPPGAISAQLGMTRNWAGQIRRRIMAADLAESGEPADEIRRHYV